MKKVIAILLMMTMLTTPTHGDLVDISSEVIEEPEVVEIIEEVPEVEIDIPEEIVIEEPVVVDEVSEEMPIEEIPEEEEEIEISDELVVDLTTVSEKTPEELAVYMHPETRHLAEDVVRICEEYGVNAEFIAAVMRWERRPDLCNWFGWTGASGLMTFDSDIECLETVIPLIRQNYLEPDGCYYNGATVEGVSIFYNNSDFWRDTIAAEVARMM